jgi:phosphatidylglycerophosphate synthase
LRHRLEMTLPNMLSCFRILAAPVMLGLAVAGSRAWFMSVFAMSLVSDTFDGMIARHRHAATITGARLDSLGDLMIVLTLLPGVWLLWPEIVKRESVYIVVGLLSYLLPTVIGFVRFGRMTSYHTYGAKAMAVLTGISLVLLFLDVTRLPFRVCVPLAVLEGIEEVAITFVLPQWRANVPSLIHALRLKRSG